MLVRTSIFMVISYFCFASTLNAQLYKIEVMNNTTTTYMISLDECRKERSETYGPKKGLRICSGDSNEIVLQPNEIQTISLEPGKRILQRQIAEPLDIAKEYVLLCKIFSCDDCDDEIYTFLGGHKYKGKLPSKITLEHDLNHLVHLKIEGDCPFSVLNGDEDPCKQFDCENKQF